MELRIAFFLIGSVLAVALGYQQCRDQRKCIPFEDCPEFRSYRGSYKTWNKTVQKEVKRLFCGWGDGKGNKKIQKYCCIPENPKKQLALPLKCGRSSRPRIAHGELADIYEYPWMTLLGGTDGKFHCGGSLIAERFVLTAAHCNQIKVTFVRVGETDLSTVKDCIHAENGENCADPIQDIPVATNGFIRHSNYSSSKKKNDIALVKLSEPARLNENVEPICLPLPEFSKKKLPAKMTVSGWGYTEDRQEISKQLRYAHVTILAQRRCRKSLRSLSDVYSLDKGQICAGDESDLGDHCKGDSGGPLQYYGKEGFVVHGVVSYGLSTCGQQRAPGVYANVPHYVNWIVENLK